MRDLPWDSSFGDAALPRLHIQALRHPAARDAQAVPRALCSFRSVGAWLFLFVNAVSPDLRAEGERGRALYLAKVQPILDRSEPGEFGMIPPRDVLPAPTFAPFVPAMRPSQGGPGVEVRESRGMDRAR